MLSGKRKLNQQPDTSTCPWEWLTIYNLRIPSAGRTEQGDVTRHSSAPGSLCQPRVIPRAPLARDPPPALPLSRQVTVANGSPSSRAVPPDTPVGHHVWTWGVQSQPHILHSALWRVTSYRWLPTTHGGNTASSQFCCRCLFVIVAHVKTMSDIRNTPKEQEVDVHPNTLHENSQQHEL